MPRPTLSRIVLSRIACLALAFGGVTTASGCIVIADGGSYSSWDDSTVKETRVTHVDHVAGSAIKVGSFNGAVAIRKGGTDKVDVTAKIRARTSERLQQVVIRTERSGDGVLHIEPLFPGNQHKGGEGVSFDITIPDTAGVSVQTSNGAIDVDGLAGPVDLRSSNGAITLTAHAGNATLETSNGAIKVRGTTGDINADTSNGHIDIVGATGKVVADSSNGAIECEMAPSAPGPVNLDTSNGSIRLTIGPEFGGELEADTSNASVSLVNVRAASSKVAKGHASLKFEKTGGKSVLDTSNGSITVKSAG
jgi:DUF4097 and DUF4098 domain-containing protein YvlB